MKLNFKQVILFGAVFSLVFSLTIFDNQTAFGDHTSKIVVCHKGQTLEISYNALKAHMKHGDTEGKCNEDSNMMKNTVLTGDGPPPGKLGEIGDLYFNSTKDDSLEYYVKISNKVWEYRGTLVQPSTECITGNILKYNQTDNKWNCAIDLDTLENLSCSDNQIVQWNATSNKWDCADNSSSDTLANLSCNDTQIAKWNATAIKWDCSDDFVDDNDIDPSNELQTLSQSDSTVTLDQGGGSISINDNDSDPTNELQTIAITTKISPEYNILELESITDSLDCDAGWTATDLTILWITKDGVGQFTDISFSGPTATYTVFETTSNNRVELKVMVTCMQLSP